jgi:hypothetical protein
VAVEAPDSLIDSLMGHKTYKPKYGRGGIVGGVEIEHDLAWRLRMRVEKQLDEQLLVTLPRNLSRCGRAVFAKSAMSCA